MNKREEQIREMYKKMNMPLSKRDFLYPDKFQALSQYGYCLKFGFASAQDAENYVIEFYKNREDLTDQ